MKEFSLVAKRLTGQPMFNLMAVARNLESQGKRVLHFEIGDPNFNSPMEVKQRAQKALEENWTHYTNSFGLLEFREAVREHVYQINGFRPDLDQVLIAPANAIIDFVVRCVVNPGEEIIFPDPGFCTYASVVGYNGMIPVGVPLLEKNGFRMAPHDIEEAITEKTRLIIVNSPNNPTGSIMTEEESRQIAQLALKKDLYLLSDETYSRMLYEGRHFSPCALDQCRERTIILNSLSKTYAMSGWRLGYVVGPSALIAKMGLLLQTIVSCLPAFTQWGGVQALQMPLDFLDRRMGILRKRRDRLVEGLNQLPRMSCLLPQGAFYAFANIERTGLSCDEYAGRLLQETGVCVLPGNCFGSHGEGHVRLSYAGIPQEEIEEALVKMRSFHQKWES